MYKVILIAIFKTMHFHITIRDALKNGLMNDIVLPPSLLSQYDSDKSKLKDPF